MKLLMAGDTHGNQTHCRYLIDKAVQNECDRVFVLGDFGYWEHTQSGVKFLKKLNRYATTNNMPVYFLDGNHDKISRLLKKYQETDDEGFVLVRPMIRYAGRGHRWSWGGIRFISLGGAYSVDKDWRLEREAHTKKPETLWFPEEEMSDEDMTKILENTESVHVMLAHDKPRGSNPGWNRKDFNECFPNQDRLQRAVRTLQPLQYWHGHLHRWYQCDMDYSDLEGNHRHCQVQGLQADPEAGVHYLDMRYATTQSWQVLDTDELLLEMV